MSGDNPSLWACHYNHLLRNRNHTLHCSAMLEIDEGIEAIEISNDHAKPAGFDKLDNRVSTGMGIWRMEDTGRLAIQVNRTPVRECHNQ